MRVKTFASIALLAMLVTVELRAQQSDTSIASSPVWNDNSLIAVQKYGGDPTRPGDVRIEFYGHDAFKITSPAGLTILTDPWRNDPTGLYPRWFLTDFPPIRFDNAIQIIGTGGLRIAVWGDNRGVPDPSLDPYLKNVDVLILPIDTVLTRPEVDAIVRKYDPKAIIPAHYFVEGLTTAASGLESADSWVNDQEKIHHADVRRLDRAELTLNPVELKGCHHRVYYFGNHFEKK